MKGTKFGKKLLTSVLATMLIAPTVLGAVTVGGTSVNAAESSLTEVVEDDFTPTDIVIARNGQSVSATIKEGTTVTVFDRNQNELGTSETGEKIELARRLEPGEIFYLVATNTETSKESEKKWATYKEKLPVFSEEPVISEDGKTVTATVSEEEELVVKSTDDKELGRSKTGVVELETPLKEREIISTYLHNTETELDGYTSQITYYAKADISDIKISKNGREVSAKTPKDTQLNVYGDYENFLGSSIDGEVVQLNQKLEPGETIYLSIENLLTGEEGGKVSAVYNEVMPTDPEDIEISVDGTEVTATIPENTVLFVLDSEDVELGKSETGTVKLTRSLKDGEEIRVYVEGKENEIKSNTTYINFYAEEVRPEAPTNAKISEDGKSVTFDYEKNTEVTAYNNDGTEIGKNKDEGKIVFEEALKVGDWISLVATDKTTGAESDSLSVQYGIDLDLKAPANVEVNEQGTIIYADAQTDYARVVVIDSKGEYLGSARAFKDYTSVMRLDRKLAKGETVKVYTESYFNDKKSEATSLTYKKADPQGPYISYGKYVTVTKNNYNTYQNFDWKKKQSAEAVTGKTYLAKGKYNHENGSTYLSLYDDKGVWQGYINEKATEIANGKQGAFIKQDRYATVTSKNYKAYQNFGWQEKQSAEAITGKTYHIKGKYNHANGSTYLSLYDDKGVWQGYINEKATKAGDGKQGAYISDGRQVKVTKKGYNTWQNFSWKKKQSTDGLVGKEFTARGRYQHINGSTYYSIYDAKGVWQGYISSNATNLK